MERSRIMLVISNLEYGGAERQVLALAQHLDRRRFEPHICTLAAHAPLARDLQCDAPLHRVVKKGRFDVSVIPRLTSLLKQLRIDLVHGFLFDAEIASRLAGRFARVRAVVSSERNSNYRRPWLHTIALHLTKQMSDGLVANSLAGKLFSVRTLGLPESSVHVVYNGVDTDKFFPRPSEILRHTLGLDPEERIVGMVSTFKRQKNYEMFLAVAQQVLRQQPDVRFVSVGSPQLDGQTGESDYYKEITALARSLNLDDRCLFLGRRNDVADLYNLFDITVLTSTREGTPNVLLEAMASGAPVVVTDVADNATHVRHGETGYVVPLNNVEAMTEKILTLLSDEPKRRERNAAGRRKVGEE